MNKVNLSYQIKPLTVFSAYDEIWAFKFRISECWKACTCLCEPDSFSVDKYFSDKTGGIWIWSFHMHNETCQHLGDLVTQGSNILVVCYLHAPMHVTNHVWVTISIQSTR